MRSMKGKLRRASRRSASAPSRSWTLAGVDADGEQQAERVGQDVALAADAPSCQRRSRTGRAKPPFEGALGGLAVDDRRRRAALRGPPSLGPRHRARGGCARAFRPSPTGRDTPRRCCAAADPWAAPSTGSRSRARRRSAFEDFANVHRPRTSATLGWTGSAGGPAPIRRPSDRSDSADPRRSAAARCSGFHMRRLLRTSGARKRITTNSSELNFFPDGLLASGCL